jgi:hypothetical protein
MSQAISTPDIIVTKVVNKGNISEDAILLEVVKEKIKDYAREVAMVAIILSDNYMKVLYEKTHIGYMCCLDELHTWAVEYVTKFAHVEDWEEFLDTDRTYGECLCWDDHVVMFGKHKLENYV